MSRLHAVPCPAPDCDGTLWCRDDLPEGEYRCSCHAVLLRLSWCVRLEPPKRYPVLDLVPGAVPAHGTMREAEGGPKRRRQ